MQSSCEPLPFQRAGVPITVRVAHGHALLAAGIRATLAPLSRVADAATSPGEFISVLVTDLAQVMKFRARADAGVQTASVLVVESGLTLQKVKALLQSGVQGCVSADGGPGELLTAVRTLVSGGTYFCPLASSLLADALLHEQLTSREQRVLELLCDGLDNKSIGNRMQIAPGTVKCHVRAILAKTGTRTRTAIAARAIREGWVTTAP